MALAITNSNYDEIMNSGKPVVIDFWAEWCGPCRMVGPIIEALAEKYEGKIIIGKCDVTDNNEIAKKYSVMNIPTIVMIKNGEVVEKQIGACSQDALEAKIECLM